MSVRAFAAHLGVSAASVANWEQRGDRIRLRDETQEILDRDLSRADNAVHERFRAALDALFSPAVGADGDQAERLASTLAKPRSADSTTVAYLRAQIAQLDAEYDGRPSASLLGPAGECHGQIAFLCAHADRDAVRYELLPALAESAILMGQLVWDASLRRDHASALSYFTVAVDAATQLGERALPLAARAQLRGSLVALYGQKRPKIGLAMAAQAAATGNTVSHALTGLALLHVAEAHAMQGEHLACESSLGKADAALQKATTNDPAKLLLAPSDFNRMAGSCYLRLGNTNQAISLLDDTVRNAGHTKATAVAAGNLALAYTAAGKIDEAVGGLHRAIDIVDVTVGGGGLATAFTAGRALNPWRRDPAVQQIHDRLFACIALEEFR